MLMALPRQRQCLITDALPGLDYREHYKQAVLPVESGVHWVPGRVGCDANSETQQVFGGYTGRSCQYYRCAGSSFIKIEVTISSCIA